MVVLAADTTTPGGSVALLAARTLLGEVNLETPATHSVRLFPSIDFLLRAHGMTVRDIEGFAVAAGPGSFTGIRIGLGAVKSLALASGKPAVAVSTLAALAAKLAGPCPGLACPVLDARKGQVYAALFESAGGAGAEVVPQGAYGPAEFLDLLPAGRPVSFIGSGALAFESAIRARLGDKAVFPLRSPFIAAEVGRIGMDALGRGGGVEARDLQPLYFRKSQAEEKPLR